MMARQEHTPPSPVPPAVAQKLHDCGETMTPEQWARLPRAARNRLLQLPAGTVVERRAFTSVVRWLLRTFTDPPA